MSEFHVLLKEEGDQGGGGICRMEGTTENVDSHLENVSPSYSSNSYHEL